MTETSSNSLGFCFYFLENLVANGGYVIDVHLVTNNYTTNNTHRIKKGQYLHEIFACSMVKFWNNICARDLEVINHFHLHRL